MYLRFTTTYRDSRGRTHTGVFQALGYLSDCNSTQEYDRENMKKILRWFGHQLDRPTRFNKHSGNKYSSPALCWFKCSAVKHIGHMYQLKEILERYDLIVDVVVSKNPGYVVYQDEYQVAAIPYTKEISLVL